MSDWPGTYVLGIGAHVAEGLLALDRLEDQAVRSGFKHRATARPCSSSGLS